ncbi:hypothetical protein CQW23_14532 [Capsicum baccatum]|uniref:Ubiquitin-like protease family profile domain-containing protein n=1 Tax=Capsicum baccatum TaxID=33114 RepID=A0A2G2WJF2_CAPBA|nr:hypothetical protein CQW23_14532 [Capsicum baccatum]
MILLMLRFTETILSTPQGSGKPSNINHRGWFSAETIFQVLNSRTKMAHQEKSEVIQPPTAIDKQLESYSYTNWAGNIQEQYQKIKENAETYPYVWGSYIVVYGGFGLWFAYRWRRLCKTEDRVRVFQERLRKLVQAEESTMEDSSSFSLGLTQLDTNSVVEFVPRVFDYEEPNFVENRSKFRNDLNKMKEVRKVAAEKSKKAVEKSSRLSKTDDFGRPRLLKSQVNLDIQGFEEFSTVPPTEILKKAGLITDAATSHLTKKRKIVCFDSTTVEEQVCQKTPSFISTRNVPTQKTASSGSEHVYAEKRTSSSSLKLVCQDNSDEKWDAIKLFLQSYVSSFISNSQLSSAFDMLDVEGFSEDNATASLDALVEFMVNHNFDNTNVETSTTVHVHNDHMVDYSSTFSESAQVELDTILKVIAAPVDYVPIEVVPPTGPVVNQYDISDSQLPLDFPDDIVAAHQAVKIPAKVSKRIRTRSKVFKSPYTSEYASGSKAIEDQIEEQKQQFAFDDFLISNTMPSYVIEEFKQWVGEGLLKFHAKKRIRVYDLLSKRRNTKSITEIQKLAKMLPTYLSDNKFYDEISRTNWPNLEIYRDKITQTTQILNEHSFDVEYVQHIMQQECDNVNCGVFVVGYAEYLSEEMNVPSDGFEEEYHRMCYATLLRKYGIQKAKKGYVNENDDPPKPKSRIIQISDDNAIVYIE